MSKAVLVIEMPDCCDDCAFCDDAENCLAREAYCIDEDITCEKPEWCPLVPIPEHRKPLNKKGYRSGYIEGWNDAIEAIDPG